MPAYFVSDIHLKDQNEPNSQLLLGFLHSLQNENSNQKHLFLVGDIFDVWIGNSDFFRNRFFYIVTAVEELVRLGWNVSYFEGNHDVHVKAFWNSRGVKVFDDPQLFTLGKIKVRVEHGDFINPKDVGYHKYRVAIKAPIYEKLAHLLPGRLWHWAATYAGKKSRARSGLYRSKNEESLRQMIRSFASEVFKLNHFDLIVTGHVHVRDDFKSDRFRSINLGSWFEDPCFFRLNDEGVGQFHYLKGNKQ